MRRPSATTNERNVLVLTGVAHFGTHFFELMYPTLAVSLAHQASVPVEQVLGWSFLGYLLFGLGALPAGLLADRIGARILLVAGMGGMGVASLAASGVSGGTPLMLCLAFLGLFGSIYHPAGMSLISRTIPARGRALGVNGIFGNLALAATPFVTAKLCESFTWQGAYGIAGFTMCALAIACGFLPIAEPPHGEQRIAFEPVRANGDRRLFVLLCVAAMLGGLSYRGNTLIQPAYFAERVSGLGFGTTTSLVYLFGIGGQYLGGLLADRRDLRWLYLAFHGLSLPALLLMASTSGASLIGSGALFVFFSLGMQPIENSLFARFTPPRWRGTGYGIKFVLTFGVGALAVRFVEGMKAEADLATVILSLAAVVAVLVGVIAMFIGVSGGTAIRNEVRADALADAPPAIL